MATLYLTIGALITALIHMRAEYLGPDIHIYIFKPLTMIFIISTALIAKSINKPNYKKLILFGLIFSFIGDILLIFPDNMFVPGLVSFLIGHIIYIIAFRKGRKFNVFHWIQLPLLVYGFTVYSILAPGLDDMKIPVLAYIIVILCMFWQAYEQWESNRNKWALYALVGASFFVISDTILAFNKFGFPFEASRWMNLSAYFIAQWLISHSIWQEKA